MVANAHFFWNRINVSIMLASGTKCILEKSLLAHLLLLSGTSSF